MTATATPAQIQLQPARTHPTNIVQQSWIMVKRNMIHTKRMPEMLSDVTVQPIMFVLLFAFVFGASIATLTWRRALSIGLGRCRSRGRRC